METSLTRRLLRAARSTYTLINNKDRLLHDDDYAQIGWLDGSVREYIAGTDRIDAAIVGETATEIIVAFRGTTSLSTPDPELVLLDWLNDFKVGLNGHSGLGGRVHAGFFESWSNVLNQGLVQHPALTAGTKPVCITGHSKGGAMAYLAAKSLCAGLQSAGRGLRVVTFAAARPGDAAFQQAYDAAVPHTTRYEFQDDIVPHVPPSGELMKLVGHLAKINNKLSVFEPVYNCVGTLLFINWSKQIVHDSLQLQLMRYEKLTAKILKGGLADIVREHSVRAGSGYDSAPYDDAALI